MRFRASAAVGCFAFVQAVVPSWAQDSQSKLGVFIGVAFPESKNLLVKDSNGKLLDKFKWTKGLPTYVEFFLPAKRYNIDIPGPIKSIEVETSSDVQTFVQYVPITTERGEHGVQITSWRGEPNSTIAKAILELKDAKAGPALVKWDPESNGKTIFFSTDPPWPNPFEKPNPPPNPPPPK
jgi:hypothetical protein